MRQSLAASIKLERIRMEFSRMLNEDQDPSEEEILTTIGNTDLWLNLKKYIDQSYDIIPEKVFYGKKYGWTIRYRKSGKTLCSLFPEHGAFTTLVVLGKKEGGKASQIFDDLTPSTRQLFGSTKQLHDGKWLWIRVHQPDHVEDIKRLLALKRKPIIR
jgi:hypothetical protein